MRVEFIFKGHKKAQNLLPWNDGRILKRRIGALLVIWVLYRYGLLALISSIFFLHLVIFYPITSDLSAWYAADFVLALSWL